MRYLTLEDFKEIQNISGGKKLWFIILLVLNKDIFSEKVMSISRQRIPEVTRLMLNIILVQEKYIKQSGLSCFYYVKKMYKFLSLVPKPPLC